jgi:hypothetical protein
MDTLRHWIMNAEAVTGLPRHALYASVVLAFGFLFAFVVRSVVARFVREIGRLMSARGTVGAVEDTMARHRIDTLLGRGAFWIAVLLTLMSATQLLGLPVVTTWLGGIAAYLPRLLMGLLIVFIGVVAGAVARSALARALPITPVLDPERLGGVVQLLVVGVSMLVAVQQLGIDVGLLTTAVTIAFVGFFGATALAFGFGGRTTVANILAGHYVRELYEVGHTVRVQGLEGRIVRMTPTAVIVSTSDGETAVPTQLFVESLSTRIATGGRT